MFHRKRETRNQVRNRDASAKLFSHNQLENVINIENNLFSKKQVNEENEAFNYTHDTFQSNENKIEINLSSINIAKKLRK